MPPRPGVNAHRFLMKIVLATRNPGKVREMRALLSALPVELISAAEIENAPEIEEDAETLEGNARKKASSLNRATGLPSLADDTGLEVDALGGDPGVHSARFAGSDATDADNRRKLLEALEGVKERSARFRTVIAFVDQEGMHYFEGLCRGKIITEERGHGGFGYDPIFQPEESDKTFSELSPEEKNKVSHRGRALREFESYLRARLRV